MLGGSFTLRTAAGGGTRIRIEIPVQEIENE
jgi:signal transduction histidine kinase